MFNVVAKYKNAAGGIITERYLNFTPAQEQVYHSSFFTQSGITIIEYVAVSAAVQKAISDLQAKKQTQTKPAAAVTQQAEVKTEQDAKPEEKAELNGQQNNQQGQEEKTEGEGHPAPGYGQYNRPRE